MANICFEVASLQKRPDLELQVKGTEARNLSAFFQKLSAALHFPNYFTSQLDSFEECLNDLSWLPGDVDCLT